MTSLYTGVDTRIQWTTAKMYSRTCTTPKGVIRMDPDCAICHGPATIGCDCEAKGLDVAIKQAEELMMRSIYSEIRKWVRGHAQDYILEYFRTLAERRKTQHSDHLDNITAQAYHYYHAPPHPKQLQDANASLKRGIDEDWQASVARYPEVLEYFFSLVELTLPADDEPVITDPRLPTSTPGRKGGRRAPPAIEHEREPPMLTHASPARAIGPPPGYGERGERDRGERGERGQRDDFARAYLQRGNGRTPAPAPSPRERRPQRRSMPPQPHHAPYIETPGYH